MNMRGESRHYWAFVANPRVYRVEDALSDGVRESDWIVKKADVRVGDRVAIWKAKGDEARRGIVALGEVIEAPTIRKFTNNKYWVTTPEALEDRRARIRFAVPENRPVWLEQDSSGVLSRLSVSRATGGGIFKIDPNSWERLLEVVGGWPVDEDEEEQLVAKFEELKNSRRGQLFASAAEVRGIIENHAMEQATRFFEAEGFNVVKRGKPYDLCCTRGSEELFVEVKGTQSEGESVFLTRNEVAFARKNQPQVVLFIVCNVEVRKDGSGIRAIGGNTKILRPWNVDQGRLSALVYEYCDYAT